MRAFAYFLGAILLAGLIGASVAYPAYQATATVASWAFHRVASRIAMLALILILVAVCRRLNIRSKRDFGFGLPWRQFVTQALVWALIGIATAAAGAVFLLGTGLRIIDPSFVPSAAHWTLAVLVGIGSGIAVALLEETFMRGAMHTAIESESGPWCAAFLTAPLFAILHFFAKVRIPADEVHWDSGFRLLALSFAPLGQPSLVLDSFLSWVVVGLILSLTRIWTGNIAVAIGLHAGWVVVLRVLQQTTLRSHSTDYAAWVGKVDGLLGYWMLPWGLLIGTALWFTRPMWVPYSRLRAD